MDRRKAWQNLSTLKHTNPPDTQLSHVTVRGRGMGSIITRGRWRKRRAARGRRGRKGRVRGGGASAAKKRAFLEKKAKVALNHITELESKGEAQREILNHVLGKLAKVTDDVSAAGEAAPEETQRTYARVKEVC